MADTGTPGHDHMASAISEAMDRIHRESYGYGAAEVETYVFDDHVFTVLDGIELAPGERVLIDAGRRDLVRQVRAQFQESIEATFTAAVERATGRKVLAFISYTHFDPDFMVELFRLAPDGARTGAPEG